MAKTNSIAGGLKKLDRIKNKIEYLKYNITNANYLLNLVRLERRRLMEEEIQENDEQNIGRLNEMEKMIDNLMAQNVEEKVNQIRKGLLKLAALPILKESDWMLKNIELLIVWTNNINAAILNGEIMQMIEKKEFINKIEDKYAEINEITGLIVVANRAHEILNKSNEKMTRLSGYIIDQNEAEEILEKLKDMNIEMDYIKSNGLEENSGTRIWKLWSKAARVICDIEFIEKKLVNVIAQQSMLPTNKSANEQSMPAINESKSEQPMLPINESKSEQPMPFIRELMITLLTLMQSVSSAISAASRRAFEGLIQR